MAKAIALYNPPADARAFDQYYYANHVPIAKRMPGLRSYVVNDGPIITPTGAAPYHLVAVLEFDSIGAIGAALASPEGQAVVEDLGNFATGGVTVLMFDDKPV